MSTSASERAATVQGRRYDGRSTRALPVCVRVDGDSVRLDGEGLVRVWPLDAVKLDPPLGSTARRLRLPDDSFIELDDRPDLDALFGGRSRGWLDRLESHLSAALGALAVIVGLAVVAYLWGLPWAARVVAEHVPPTWTAALSDSTIALLDKAYVGPSKLPAARQAQIREAFARWRPPAGRTRPPYRLWFRDGRVFGANALALPSGDIVVTDQLVALADSDDEVLGVLAHELGHLDRRHALRQLIQGSFVSVAAAAWMGDISGLAALSTAVLSMHYSRDFEREADAYAADMMQANAVDPMALGKLLAALESAQHRDGNGDDGDGAQAFMSTHPVTAERLDYLRQRAAQR
ncbi:MAG: M48 family metallopeptidase [Rhodocyclaceae bacterium]